MKFSLVTKSLGAKIAIATSAALVFVTALFLVIFHILDFSFLTKFNLIQLLVVLVLLLVFVEVLLVMLATNFFAGRPLQKLTEVMKIAEKGNCLVRAPVLSEDELGELAQSFNTMLAKITDLDAQKIEAERELIIAQESLKYKEELEEKAKVIESTNQKLEASLQDLSVLYEKVKELSITDELTGIYNRRHFQNVLHMEWKRASRFRRPLSLLMLDVDYFKKFNDTFGHVKGDEALKFLTGVLSEHIREVDTLARFGGEEFVLLLPDTSLSDACLVGEKLKNLIHEQTTCPIEKGGLGYALNVSVGISSFPEEAATEEEILNTADIALYRAKAMGRDQVVRHQRVESDLKKWPKAV